MNVPFVDLHAQYQAIKKEIDTAMQQVIHDTAFVGGPYLKAFEDHFASYLDIQHCIGVANGTDALFVALKCLGIKPGDEVITAANSFIATSEAITATGARVVFVDCEPDTYLIDVTKIEAKITPQTKAIIPVHLYGQPADMDGIRAIADRHHLAVVEDAAQAHGATYKGQTVGTLGTCACFSFYPGKNLGAYGDGGAIVTNDADLARTMRMYANHGRVEKYNHEFEGVNSRLDGLQAAILDVKLRHLDAWNDRRRAIAARYDQLLAGTVTTPKVCSEVQHVYHLYVVRMQNRDQVRTALAERGIATGIHYPIPLPFLTAYQYLQHTPDDFPVATAVKDELVSLPIHGNMPDAQVDYVVEQIKDLV
ncbi:aminotransferase class I/II-fold pyridoxal phosphate-dependent enzyme [candidate division KSB3 bacterium]|uniref:Aminotransferase class I/II-fold pyridoxal phosphate-dependent enzyme n=1 Tax=candidate division KSB3 bacterium TaxID=2044937 RepID=A0A9D5JXM6_9BACT|nr:aminotransferase class I/II-fold pyridoxal phosphate-dependent enzyme [candidate division KSB3 bacterium]MBD3326199.1 aminotransferase class I/II-fold pyridoxal phosphate-dependent enzyme [candidate division KSB3 bacterium]